MVSKSITLVILSWHNCLMYSIVSGNIVAEKKGSFGSEIDCD